MNDDLPPALLGGVHRAKAIASRLGTTLRLEASRLLGPAARRALDLSITGSALLAAAPVIATAAAAIKLTSPGPVLYRQIRVGKGGAPFALYKLRTMYIDADERLAALRGQNESKGGITFKIKRDPRITPVGRVLRKFSIDELPQLWNVLNGTMTVFGPRPPLPREVAAYGARARRRLEVTPGLTCSWQVGGRSDLSFDQQIELDLSFIDTSTPADGW